MQRSYKAPGDRHLPWCVSQEVHPLHHLTSRARQTCKAACRSLLHFLQPLTTNRHFEQPSGGICMFAFFAEMRWKASAVAACAVGGFGPVLASAPRGGVVSCSSSNTPSAIMKPASTQAYQTSASAKAGAPQIGREPGCQLLTSLWLPVWAS